MKRAREVDLVSVIIPTYNSSKYISSAIDSIKSQNVAHDIKVEVVLVDDFSDDVSELITITSKYDFIKVYAKNKKGNAAESRNIGIKESKGDIVFFLDSDDEFKKGYINKRIFLHTVNKNGVIFGGFLLNDTPLNFSPYENENFIDYLFKNNGDIRSSTISIYKPYYSGSVFDENQEKHQDWGFGINAYINNESIYFDTEPLVNIRSEVNENRMSNSNNIKASKYFIDSFNILGDNRFFFIKRVFLSSILKSDRLGITFLRKEIFNEIRNFSISVFFYSILLLFLSYRPFSYFLNFLKFMKDRVVKKR